MTKRQFDEIDVEINAAIAEINSASSNRIGPKSIFGNYTLADLSNGSRHVSPVTSPNKILDTGLIELIRQAAQKVFVELGRGHVETVYRDALAFELQSVAARLMCDGCQLKSKTEVTIPIHYDSFPIGFKRADIMLTFKAPDTDGEEKTVVVELKSLASSLNVQHAQQTLSYIRSIGAHVGILFNFDQRSNMVQRMLDSKAQNNVVYDAVQLAPCSNLVLEFFAVVSSSK